MDTEDTFDLEKYKQTIEDTEDTIKNLGKTQYHMMLAGEDEKVDNLGKMISNLETVRDDLKTQLWGAMGAYSTDYPNKTPDWVTDSSIMAIPELSTGNGNNTGSSSGIVNLNSGNQAGTRSNGGVVELSSDTQSDAGVVELSNGNETAIAQTDYETQLADLQRQLDFRKDMADSYAAYMAAEPYGANYDTYQEAYNRNLDISVELENEIKALEVEHKFNIDNFINTTNEISEYVEPIINAADDLKTVGLVKDIPKVLKFGGKALTVLGGVLDAYDVGSTVYDDFNDSNNIVEKETVETIVGTGASWGGGALGAWAGVKAGAVVGAAIGSIISGAGTAAGAIIGGIIGGVGGTIFGSIQGEEVGEYVAGKTYNLINGFDKSLGSW